MTKFNVHIYRELRLAFEGIEADTHEAAAAIARDKPTGDADDIDECDGDTFYGCVDVQGDENYEQSRWIDFEPERERLAASKLLAALKACELQLREYVRWHHAHAGGCSVEIESAWEQARDAIAEAETVGIRPAPTASRLSAALRAVLPYAENEAYALEKHQDSPEAEAEAERAWKAINAAHALLAEASAAGIRPAPVDPAVQTALIPAEAHSDDHVIRVEFDALPWFARATDEEIVALARCGWGDDYPADAVAVGLADTVPALARLFSYLEIIANDRLKKDCCGFECRVDEARALEWLQGHRPSLGARVAENTLPGAAAGTDEAEEA